MHIGKHNPGHSYTMNDSASGQTFMLTDTVLERDLGVLISADLKWAEQVEKNVSKANSMLGLLRHTFSYRGADLWKKLYTTYVRPQLEFAVAVWNPYLKGDIKALEGVQHRATKIAHSMKRHSYEERCEQLDLTSLENRRIRGDMIQHFKFENDIDSVYWLKEPYRRLPEERGKSN